MTEVTVVLPKLHKGQRKCYRERKRFNTVNCGRRWGKTLFGIYLVCLTALDGHPAGWFAPEYKYLLPAWEECKRRLAPITKRTSEQQKLIELHTGGTIEFWSMSDEDAGRSRKYKRVVMDESAMVLNLESIYNNAIRPTLSDLIGDAWMLSTPKGMNFFRRRWDLGQKGGDKYSSWTMPTSTNPYIAASEIAEAKAELPERVFRQEFLAEFLEDAGGVFTGVRDAINPVAPVRRGDALILAGQHVGPFVMGVDLARYNDFTVISVVDSTGKQIFFLRLQGMPWERQCDQIEKVAKIFPSVTIVVDATGMGDPVAEMLINRGLMVTPYKISATSKKALIDNLAMRIERKEALLLDVDEQTRELVAYEYQRTPSGRFTTNAPEGMHDDTVIALGLCYVNAVGMIIELGSRFPGEVEEDDPFD